ncbi:Major facilitator superfamily domain-containing protein 6 [Eumeta japonica]|uniref:Major facilitator superfamily domain-containing protein 6 n=1 Tax=Eumeta variegata TaxID=151549 RepID=A0A4C1TFH0_EUMVA|nr:Major facilitator superfamily domain-containing protein 6 [Eumeta japonica]
MTGCPDEESKKAEEDDSAMDDDGDDEIGCFGRLVMWLRINPNLIMLKITLFVMYGATASLLPYLTIHMQSIGLTVPEISFVYLALPFTTFLSPPITGFLVDRFGEYKPVVITALILNAAFHHSLLLIPHQETPGAMPAAYVMQHPITKSVEIWWSPCPSRECPDEDEEVHFVLDRCVDHCLLSQPTERSASDPADDKDDIDVQIIRKITPPNLANSSLFNNTDEDYNDVAFFLIEVHDDLGEPKEQLGMAMERDENGTVTDFRSRFGEKLLVASGVNLTALDKEDLRCGGMVQRHNMTKLSQQRLSEWAADCMVQKCDFRKGGPDICPPDYKESDDKTFYIYFFLRFMGTIMLSAGVTIMDPIALTMIQKYGGDFGRERLFSSIGMAIFSPITGYTDYSAAFYTYDVLLLISAATVAVMPLGAKLPADNLLHDLINIIKMPHIIIFIFFLFALGNFWGFIESYLFLYLKELGAPNFLLGITVTVGTLSSIPFLYGADAITARIGHVNVIIVAFFSHAARLVGYSFIENSWWCFPFEAMESLSVHLMWVAAATYCAMLAPKSLLATLIGVLGMAHFSLGRGSGSFGGGLLIASVGTREAFLYMGLIAFLGGILYGLLHYFWLRKIATSSRDNGCDHDTESGEGDKMNGEPLRKDAETMVSLERLHMITRFNPLGSLHSLPRGSRARLSQGDINELCRSRSGSNSQRRCSNIEISPKSPRGSASKVDLLRSTLEISHHQGRGHISNPALANSSRPNHHPYKLAHSAPKLSQRNNISQPILSEFDLRRRDSIPEEAEEDKMAVPPRLPVKTKSEDISPPPTYAQTITEHRKSWHSDDSTPT